MEIGKSSAEEYHLLRSDVLVICLFTGLYLPQVAHPAVTRPFWIDELFTYYVVTMPDWAGVMDLVQRGADLNPPLFHALTRLGVRVLGESEWVFRLPAMIGYWVFCVMLYVWVRLLGGGQTSALVAMVTPVLSGAVYYASEARPYSLVLGLLGSGLVCYQLAQTPRWQRQATVGLALSLSLAVSLHYLAVLPIGIFWLLEMYQSWHQRRFDRWRWGALLMPLLALALHGPLLYQQAQIPFWKNKLDWKELLDFYRWLFQPWPFLGLVVIVGATPILARRRATPANQPAHVRHWLFAGLVFACLLPTGWMIFLKLVGKTLFVERYLLAAVVGIALLLAYPLRNLTKPYSVLARAGVWAMIGLSGLTLAWQPWQRKLPSVAEIIALPNPSQPIVVDVVKFFQLHHYLGENLPPQVRYVFGIMTYRQPSDPNTGLRAVLRHPRAPRFDDMDEFLGTYRRFYVVCHKTKEPEVVSYLNEKQAPLVRETDEYFVFDYTQSIFQSLK
ncbi:MAG: hypothetical protein ACUVR8_12705 [Acidobacteriota bacterium]